MLVALLLVGGVAWHATGIPAGWPSEDLVAADCPSGKGCYLADGIGNLFFLNIDQWSISWRTRACGREGIRSLHFRSILHGWIRCGDGRILATADAGRSFASPDGSVPPAMEQALKRSVEPPLPDACRPIRAAQARWAACARLPGAGEARRLLAGESGSVALVAGGKNAGIARSTIWNKIRYSQLVVAGNGKGFLACGPDGLWRVDASGTVGGKLSSKACAKVRASSTAVWMLESNGCAWKTGGEGPAGIGCWPKLDLSALYIEDALRGWLAGRDGQMLFTADGGASWTRYRGPWHGSPVTLTRGGQRGSFYLSTDAGDVWWVDGTVAKGPIDRCRRLCDGLDGPAACCLDGDELCMLKEENVEECVKTRGLSPGARVATLDGEKLIAITPQGALFASEDGGISWMASELPNHARARLAACSAPLAECLVSDAAGRLFVLWFE
ncbi:MAG: hypothetical protein D6806_08675 [Deltaproteobacteria bacterium]|nr:MAG: hypothetical protein D6806_08675 [Deltaproteobacteria bacterium]